MSTAASKEGVSMVWVTAPSVEVAESLADKIVTEKLAACVNIMPTLHSVYYWDGKVNKDQEAGMLIKTTTAKVGELRDCVMKNHPYDVPAFVTYEVDSDRSSLPFLDWVRESVSRA